MRRSIWERIQEIINKHVIHGKWVRSVIALSCVVIFITTYVLVMPAVTLSGTPDCGQEEHRHTDDCYETQSEQICGLEEHTHSDDCYDEDGNLICGLEEHAHNDGCYTTREVLVCGMEEHTHTADCYPEETKEEEAQEAASGSSTDAGQDVSGTEQNEEVTEEVNEEAAGAAQTDEAAGTAQTDEAAEVQAPYAGQLLAEGDDFTITVFCTEEANLPADVSLKVKEITKKKEYEAYKSQVEEELIDPESKKVTGARFFDITLLDSEGNELKPEKGVTVVIETKDTLKEDVEVQVCHFDEEKNKPVKVESQEVINETYEKENLGVQFEAESFSVYGIVGTESITVPFTTGDGRTYEVTVDFDKDAGIPEGAQLKVSEVTEDNSKYADYVEQATDAVDSRAEALNYIKLLNIEIVDENGDKVDLEAPVDVTIKLLDKEQNEEEQTQVVHFEGANEMPVVLDSSAEADTVSFSADGFSVYAIVYTVDFTYTDPVSGNAYYYSLEGGKSINLTELLVVLGIKSEDEVEEFVAEEVEDVKFSDPELVKVTHNGKSLSLFDKEDWKLESLQPFNTEETLTISLKNGEKIVVRVTDAGPTPLTEVGTITGVDLVTGQNVDPNSMPLDASFRVRISYSITDPVSAKDQTPWTYDLTSVISNSSVEQIPNITGTDHRIMFAGSDYGYYTVQNGVVYLNIEKPLPTSNVTGYFDLTLQLNASEDKEGKKETIQFPGNVNFEITYKDVNITSTKYVENVDHNSGGDSGQEKILEKDANGNYIAHYKVWVKSDKELSNLTLSDTLGAGQTLNTNSIVVYSDDQVRHQVTGVSGNPFSFDIAQYYSGKITKNTNYYVEYTTTIPKDKVGENIENTASWKIYGKDTYPGGHTNIKVKKESSVKKVFTKTGTDPDFTYTYTITLGDSTTNMKGHTITDSMTDDQTFQGTSVTITGPNGFNTTVPVSTDLTDDTFDGNYKQLFEYTFPSDRDYYGPYTVTYTTKLADPDTSGLSGWKDVKNETKDKTTNESSGQVGDSYNFGEGNKPVTFEKDFDRFDTETEEGSNLVWYTFHLESNNGYPIKNVTLKDDQARYKDASGQERAMTPRWDLATFTVNGSTVTPIFRDGAQRPVTDKTKTDTVFFEELNGPLTVHFAAQCPVEFVPGLYTKNYGQYEINGTWGGDDAEKTYSASELNVQKSVYHDQEADEYVWTVKINPEKHTYDPDIIPAFFEDEIPEGMEIVSFNAWNFDENQSNGAILMWVDDDVKQVKDIGQPSGYTKAYSKESSVHGRVIGPINLSIEKMIYDASNHYKGELRQIGLSGHCFYLQYKTKVTDSKPQYGEEHVYTNEAQVKNEGGDILGEDSETVTVQYEAIQKMDMSPHDLPIDIILYNIICNPEAKDLDPDSDTLTMSDTLPTNVELVLDSAKSVKVYDENDNLMTDCPVSYNDDTRQLKVEIPDGRKIKVTYEVIASQVDGTAKFENTAVLQADREYTITINKEHKIVEHSAGIQGTNDTIYIKKYDENEISKSLEDAEFELYEVFFDPNTYLKTGEQKVGDIYKSDNTGLVTISGLQDLHMYYWKEVKAPEGYELTKWYQAPHYFVKYSTPDQQTRAKEIDNKFQEANNESMGDQFIDGRVHVLAVKGLYIWRYGNVKKNSKSFTFDKEWYGTDTSEIVDWPVGENGNQIPIKVTVTRKLKVDGRDTLIDETGSDQFSATYNLTPDSHEGWNVEETGKMYAFTLDGLETSGTIDGTDGEWMYFVTEAHLDGYYTEYYLKDSASKQTPDKPSTDDGGKIKNILAAYELPETGGLGTTPFYTIGLLLIAFAAGLYTYLNRKNLIAIRSDRRTSGTGHGKNRRIGGDGL